MRQANIQTPQQKIQDSVFPGVDSELIINKSVSIETLKSHIVRIFTSIVYPAGTGKRRAYSRTQSSQSYFISYLLFSLNPGHFY